MLANVEFNDYNTIMMLMRYLELSWFKSQVIGLISLKYNFPNVVFRYVLAPTQPTPNNMLPVKFDQTDIDYMINLGYADALTAIQKGEGVSMDEFMEQALIFEKKISLVIEFVNELII